MTTIEAKIATEGAKPVEGKAAKLSQEAAAAKLAYQGKGEALANTIIHEAMGQAETWGRYYRDLCALEAFGRAALRSRIAAHVKVKPDNDVEVTRNKSAKSRLSEFTTITKAMDAMIEFDPKWSFHYAVGVARVGLRAAGAGSKAGKKKMPFLDALKAWLEGHATGTADYQAAADFCAMRGMRLQVKIDKAREQIAA